MWSFIAIYNGILEVSIQEKKVISNEIPRIQPLRLSVLQNIFSYYKSLKRKF